MVCYLGWAAFKAKGNAAAIQDLILWVRLQAWEEKPKRSSFNFIEMFRQALMMNYETKSLVYFEPKVEKFKLENFALLCKW
jgi:DNA polymerase-3 subunit delta'